MTTEHDEQAALIQWARNAAVEFPVLRWLHAIPNGGLRDKVTARKMQAEGTLPGVADLFLPVAYRDVHGLYIEMKTATGRQSPAQEDFQSFVESQGYQYKVCRSWIEAARCILVYLGADAAQIARLVGGEV